MSKPEKFLSIGISILEAQGEKPSCNAKELWRFIQQGEELLKTQGIFPAEGMQYNADGAQCNTGGVPCNAEGSLHITVLNENGEPVPAQVKLFPLQKDERWETFQKVNGRIDMLREMTGEDGELWIKLPFGAYAVEISKGSEYTIRRDGVEVTEEEAAKSYQLTRFVNLREKGYYAGDLHHHSIYSSPVYGGDDDVCETTQEVSCSMRAMGLSFGALSDHHNTLNHEDWRGQEKKDFIPIISKEISTSNGHVLSLGVEKDVIYHVPEEEERTEEALRAEFERITEEIRQEGGLPQLNHPRDYSASTSFPTSFYDKLDMFQTIEIWNGSHPMYDGTVNAKGGELWMGLLKQGIFLPATTGSDTHNIRANDYHELFNEMMWLCQTLKERDDIRSKLEENYREELECLELLHNRLLPAMEKWAESNLTSGGVRTYVQLEGCPTAEKILDALRKGRSFLTNGPVLYGEWQENRIALTILGNLPMEQLLIYGSGGFQRKLSLKEREETVGKDYHDYSMELAIDEEMKQCKWFFFVAASDFTNMAITNPTQNMQCFWALKSN